ncbi:hypothetical protein PRIPAC_78172 [Pristionchus pacificus]|uniref:Uncharacterized protein n=1 Tax=Pristionchus pacificus TaxID=54126 RepID=A0A2A6BHK9_PRIPA|nr:hypothetical protein PRIPAC_78172 [Pristionchus pacificus]|eukprot:PDM65405.1 hypothetical protein PRIPAC_52347 [Pristionchus pacificus]
MGEHGQSISNWPARQLQCQILSSLLLLFLSTMERTRGHYSPPFPSLFDGANRIISSSMEESLHFACYLASQSEKGKRRR